MSAFEIITMAETFAERAGQMLDALDLPHAKVRAIFDGLMDQVADELPLSGAAWDLFSNKARVEFFGVLASADEQIKWRIAASAAAEDLREEEREATREQDADFVRERRRDFFGIAASIVSTERV